MSTNDAETMKALINAWLFEAANEYLKIRKELSYDECRKNWEKTLNKTS